MIRSLLVVLATMAATVVAGGPAAAADFRKAPAASAASKLRLAATETAFRQAKVYIVQMKAKPAASYQGDVAGFAKTSPERGQRYDARTGQAQLYARQLESQHDKLLASVGGSDRKLYSYVHALNGFAARLSPVQAAKLRKNPDVLRVWEDQRMPLTTNNSPKFLGITNENNGLRGALGLTGEGMIIGVIDTGAIQEHPSFEDNNYPDPPEHWAGVCQSGEGWSSSDCSNKLIGARWFVNGFTSALDLAEGEFFSARDADGHGTHTASTAAGNKAKATLNGTPIAPISGMAYRAHVAIYKGCWTGPDFSTTADDGCFFSDTAAATDAAVADGVDVISFSVGTAPAFDDPQDLAFLGAFDAGVFVARSAGNEGPGAQSTAAGEPWVISVAASTLRGTGYANATRVNAPASVAGDYPSLEGAITMPLSESGDITDDLVAADPLRACSPIAPISGIALILRGNCDFRIKITNAVNAGASAVIVYTQPGNPKVIMGGDATEKTMSIPGVMVDSEVGRALLDEINNGGGTINATLSATVFITESLVGNTMAAFSSRGEFSTVPQWIKPDVTAPGVQILAGMTPEPADGSSGDFFQYLSGTSMSTPHVAGIGALLREAHPDWSPSAIKSALMTTARQNVNKEDGVTAAKPFDFGAGHIVPNLAVDPGLVYENDFFGQLAATCGTVTPLVSDADCEFLEEDLGYHLGPSNLNLASIGAHGFVGSVVVHRTVTNVSDVASTYDATIQAPPGYRVVVEPTSLTLDPGESASFEVRIRNRAAPSGEWRFGSLTWSDGTHVVRSPIAVSGSVLEATEAVSGEGSDGTAPIDVAFGFNGTYTAGAHGLVEPFLTEVEVTDDPADSFDFSLEDDEPLVYLLEAPEGAVALRFATYDAYNDQPDHDLDLYVFYCPDFVCSLVGQSFTFTSTEEVRVQFPLNDPNIDDPYAVFVHGFNTSDGSPANSIFFDWTVEGPTGNLTVDPETVEATIGGSATINANWTGLAEGPGEKWYGAVSHSDPNEIKAITEVDVDNDGDSGYCDIVDCGP